MQVIPLKPLDNKTLEEIGLDWHTNDDMSSYIADEMVVVSQKERTLIMTLAMSFMTCL